MTFCIQLDCEPGVQSADAAQVVDTLGVREASGIWTLREASGEPWCCVFLASNEAIVEVKLEVSLASPNLLRNAAHALGVAVSLADEIGAAATEDLTGEVLDRKKVAEMLDVSAHFTQRLTRLWQRTRLALTTQLHAPLEAPVVGDYTKEYFLFLLRKPGIAAALDLLGTKADEFELRSNGTNVVLIDPKLGEPVVQIISLPDNETVLVRPYWSMLPFSQLANRTLEIALHMGSRANVVPTHAGVPVEGARLQEIRDHSQGWGMDYFLWLASGGLSA